MEFWTLDLGDGYSLDRVTKKARGLFKEKVIRINSLRRDRSVEDPEGDYKDMNFSMLFNVRIMVSPDAIKFDTGNNSFAVLSREPADWEGSRRTCRSSTTRTSRSRTGPASTAEIFFSFGPFIGPFSIFPFPGRTDSNIRGLS